MLTLLAVELPTDARAPGKAGRPIIREPRPSARRVSLIFAGPEPGKSVRPYVKEVGILNLERASRIPNHLHNQEITSR